MYCTSLQISQVLGTASAAGSVTVEPLARAVPLSVSLHSMVALPVASILTLDTVTLRLPIGNGAITADAALSELVMSALLMLDTCDTRSQMVRAVSVTLRSAPMPCESSTAPR